MGSDGRLSIPSPVAMELGLEPGVLLSLQPVGGSLRLASYRELLADSLDAVTGPTRWHFLTEFLSRPLVAVETGGRIAIPPARGTGWSSSWRAKPSSPFAGLRPSTGRLPFDVLFFENACTGTIRAE